MNHLFDAHKERDGPVLAGLPSVGTSEVEVKIDFSVYWMNQRVINVRRVHHSGLWSTIWIIYWEIYLEFNDRTLIKSLFYEIHAMPFSKRDVDIWDD